MGQASRAGLTLIEITIVLAICGTITGIAGQGLISGTRLTRERSMSAELGNDTSRVLQRLAGQLRSADQGWSYVNAGGVSTYAFTLCTGLGMAAGGGIGPQFDETCTLVFDGVAGVLTATRAERRTGRMLNQEIVRNLRTPDGFRLNQLGGDGLVKGDLLQLTMVRLGSLGDGTVVMREAATTVFLRSSIYANSSLTVTSRPILP